MTGGKWQAGTDFRVGLKNKLCAYCYCIALHGAVSLTRSRSDAVTGGSEQQDDDDEKEKKGAANTTCTESVPPHRPQEMRPK